MAEYRSSCIALSQGRSRLSPSKRNRAGQFFAVFACEVDTPEPPTHRGSEVGLDQGLSHLIMSSDGLVIDPPKYLRQAEKRLKKFQRRVSRKVKSSQNRRREILRLPKATLKVVNRRRDFNHQLSRRLADDHSFITVEDLKLDSMVKNHKLAKSVNDTGLGTLITMLSYKVSETGS